MKHIVLFTDEELDDLIHGCEIEHRVNGQKIIFYVERTFCSISGSK
jgi:hypothetical protein